MLVDDVEGDGDGDDECVGVGDGFAVFDGDGDGDDFAVEDEVDCGATAAGFGDAMIGVTIGVA